MLEDTNSLDAAQRYETKRYDIQNKIKKNTIRIHFFLILRAVSVKKKVTALFVTVSMYYGYEREKTITLVP